MFRVSYSVSSALGAHLMQPNPVPPRNNSPLAAGQPQLSKSSKQSTKRSNRSNGFISKRMSAPKNAYGKLDRSLDQTLEEQPSVL